MKKIISVLLLGAVLLNSGCATIFTGTTDKIHFTSEPPDASVSINGNEVGKTPCEVTVSRSLGATVAIIKKDNYEEKTIVLQKVFNGVAVIDILTLLGVIVDLATGSVTEYSPLFYNVTLDPKYGYHQPMENTPATTPAGKTTFKIGDHVTWQHQGEWYTGTVNAMIDDNYCLVKFDNDGALTKLSFAELTLQTSSPAPATAASFKIGDHVTWQHENQWYTGTVNALIDDTHCLVKFDNDGDLTKLLYSDLTKIIK